MTTERHVNLTKNQVIAIKKIAAEDLQVNLQGNEFTLQLKENSSRSLIEVELELDGAQALNHLSLPIVGAKNSGLWVNIFFSETGQTWKKAPIKDNQISEHNTELEIPLIEAKFLQLVFYGKTLEKISNFKISNAKVLKNVNIKTKSSSHLDRLWVSENLIDGRNDYGWASEKRGKNKEDLIVFDLGSEFYISALQLQSVNEMPNCFPVGFSLSLSMDGNVWDSVANEQDFIVRKFSWYHWSFSPKRARFVQIQISKHFKLNQNEYLSKILEIEIDAICENKLHIKTSQEGLLVDYASELVPGLVVLAENNTAAPNKAVQSNDARLRKATVEYSGIVQLAKDNEANDYVVVQGSDSRLKLASEQNVGIVQLAKDKEYRANVVVQGNDSRLKEAEENSAGIVRLAKDGEVSSHAVVQGNDSRLKEAEENSAGIVRLAKDGEVSSHAVVQGNDSRLRHGATTWPGIVQFANANEEAENKALQSSDPRLKKASHSDFGRVLLAKNGEAHAEKVVVSDDDRLKEASFDKPGLVRLAQHGKSLSQAVVLADDPRLSDKREPLEHQHDYADKQHDFNSHNGFLNIKADIKLNDDTKQILPVNQYPFSVENVQGGRAAAIKGGMIVGSTEENALAVLGQNDSIVALAKSKHGAVLLSEGNYALHLPNVYKGVKSSQKSLWAEGDVKFDDKVSLAGSFLAVDMTNFSDDAFSEGDIVTIENGKLRKIKNTQQGIVGVFTKNSGLHFHDSRKGDKHIAVAIAGVVPVKIKGSVKSGQSIGGGSENTGVGRVMPENQNNRGKAIIALEDKDEQGEKLVWCLL